MLPRWGDSNGTIIFRPTIFNFYCPSKVERLELEPTFGKVEVSKVEEEEEEVKLCKQDETGLLIKPNSDENK